jgi:hypothetical protein
MAVDVMLRYAGMPCYATHAIHAMVHAYAVLCCCFMLYMLCSVMLCYVIHYVMLVMLCYAMLLGYAIFCYAMIPRGARVGWVRGVVWDLGSIWSFPALF